MDRLKEIKKRLKATTPGQWVTGGPYPSVSVIVCVDEGSTHPNCAEPPTYVPIAILDDAPVNGTQSKQALADAAFIAYAKEDIKWLIDQLELWETANKDPDLKMWKEKTRKKILETRKLGEELLALIERK
jgi:hypothetical protein